MKPDPYPSSSDGQNLPPRHRPSLESLNQETTEIDLWAFDDDMDLGEDGPGPILDPSPRGIQSIIPSPRERRQLEPHPSAPAPDNAPSAEANPAADDRQEPKKPRPHTKSGISKIEVPHLDTGLEDLEQWAELPAGQPAEEPLSDLPDENTYLTGIPDSSVNPFFEADRDSFPTDVLPDAALAKQATPWSPESDVPSHPTTRSRTGLSVIEYAGLIILLVLLVMGASAIAYFSLTRLPTETAKAGSKDFPIKGELVEIGTATTYWRMPITDGLSPDTYRRGAVLLPILELQIQQCKGAIRVVFRDENRSVIGDVLTRTARSGETMVIAATDGFDDMGMHAAYRTGASKPWSIEVLEGKSVDALAKDFKQLFEINISTDRR